MATGLELYDEAGNLIYSVTDDVGQILGSVDVAAGSSGSLTNAIFTQANAIGFSVATDYGVAPTVTISGSTLSWSYPQASTYITNAPATIFYGVY